MNRKENIVINSSALGFSLCCADMNLLHPETHEQLQVPKPWENLFSLLFEKKKMQIWSKENVMLYKETKAMNILLYFITFMLLLRIFDEYFCPRYSQRAESYLF